MIGLALTKLRLPSAVLQRAFTFTQTRLSSSCVTQTHDEMQKSETRGKEEMIWGLGLRGVLEVELGSKIETGIQ